MIGYIYKLTSPSGKSYIGQTINIKKRFNMYKTLDCKGQPKLNRAILKYGFENFTKELLIIFNDYNTVDELKEMLDTNEVNCIRIFNTLENGYNCTAGGDGTLGRIVSQESRTKCSLSNIGKTRSEETKRKMSLLKIGNTNMLGKTHTEETREKLRLINTGKTHTEETREKLRLINTGNTYCLGHKHTNETLEKMRLSKIGDKHPMYGKKHTKESNEKNRLSQLGKIVSEETKEKLRLAWIKRKEAKNIIEA